MSATPNMIQSLIRDRGRFFARNPYAVTVPASYDMPVCRAAYASYGCDEIGQPLAVFDSSASGSGKSGILFGEYGLCYDFGWRDNGGTFYYDSLIRLDFVHAGPGRRESLVAHTENNETFTLTSPSLNPLELGFVLEGICERELLTEVNLQRPFVIMPPPPGVRPLVHRPRPVPTRRPMAPGPSPMRSPAPRSGRTPGGPGIGGGTPGMNRNAPPSRNTGRSSTGRAPAPSAPSRPSQGMGRSTPPSRPSGTRSGMSGGGMSRPSGGSSRPSGGTRSSGGGSKGGFGGGSGHGGGAGRR